MVESTGLENRRCESIRGFESHSLRQTSISHSTMQKYPSGRRGSPAKGVGGLKTRARVQIPPSAPSKRPPIRVVFLLFTVVGDFIPWFNPRHPKNTSEAMDFWLVECMQRAKRVAIPPSAPKKRTHHLVLSSFFVVGGFEA